MGSEMCIRDRSGNARNAVVDGDVHVAGVEPAELADAVVDHLGDCLLYTSDAADERSSVDLGGRRIIKKKNK